MHREREIVTGSCRCRGLQERRHIANRTPKREPPWETARAHSEDRSEPSEGLWRAHRRPRLPSGYLDIRSLKDSDTEFVQLLNSVPAWYGNYIDSQAKMLQDATQGEGDHEREMYEKCRFHTGDIAA